MQIINTQSNKKELLDLSRDEPIKLYVCGITPYDYAHLGHGRCYITFDVLYRTLNFLGKKVTYVRNFTDIDDKILVKSEKEYGSKFLYEKVSKKYIDAYLQDMDQLNCLLPSKQPKVTESISSIIVFIQNLIKQGHAYESQGDVYFDVQAFPAYLQLSKHKLEDLNIGVRSEENKRKKYPLDFALWKSEEKETFFKSPWGYGRPGWHIECSVMASDHLGKTVDIHGGGQDLIFPHHENEKAQSEAHNKVPFVRLWMHNGFVCIDKEKMSKSLGNFFTLRDIFKEFDPMIVRYYMLTHHYRAPLDFAIQDLQAAQVAYNRLSLLLNQEYNKKFEKLVIKDSLIVQKMLEFLKNDFNTPGMWGVLFEHKNILKENNEERFAVKSFLQDVIGLIFHKKQEKKQNVTAEIKDLLEQREQARKQKNWKYADEIRDQLKVLGFNSQDKKIK